MYNSKRKKIDSIHFFNHFLVLQRESNQGQQEPKTKDQPLGHGFNENIEDFNYFIIVHWLKYGIIAII